MDNFSIDERLSSIVKVLVGAIDPEKLVLFGSRVNGEARVDSDYDLLIIKKNITNEREISRKAYRSLLDLNTDASVDLIIANEARFEAAGSDSFGILSEIHKTGIAIYERA
jgi:uncharacterized protein